MVWMGIRGGGEEGKLVLLSRAIRGQVVSYQIMSLE